LIGSLADKSLVRFETHGETRVSMLETIREFGIERLAESGEESAMRQAHAKRFLELAERAAPELVGPKQAAWLERLETEHDNTRAAFETLITTEAVRDGALRLSGALFRFWWTHGHLTEGRRRLEQALARPGPMDTSRARALLAAAGLADSQGDVERAETLYREALEIFAEHGDNAGTAQASYGLATVARARSELAEAEDWSERALQLWRAMGDTRGMASGLNNLAAVAFHRGEFDRAAALWEETIGLLAQAGDERARGLVLSNLGAAELSRGKPEQAIAHHREAKTVAEQLGDPWAGIQSRVNLGRALLTIDRFGEARSTLQEAVTLCRELHDSNESEALLYLGITALAEGQQAEAGLLMAESLQLARRGGRRMFVAEGLEAIGTLLVARGEAAGATRLFGAAEALREQMGAAREGVDQPDYEAAVKAARGALQPSRYREAWAAGRALSSEAAVGEALSFVAATSRSPKPAASAPSF
jgi:tetratricopeptide (TPR) repeat protein